jgi:hypothetical protein
MGEYSFPPITCAICAKALNLRADLCADENGEAIHEECYVKRITTPRSRPPVTPMSVEVQIARCPQKRIDPDVSRNNTIYSWCYR